jgi:hypothetical protein
MNLIYSLNTNLLKYDYDKSNLDKLIKSYKLSIKLANKHHNTILYTDEYGASQLGSVVGDVKFLKKDKNYLWSEAKIEALSNESIGSFIIDGDVFLNSKLNYDTNGVVFHNYDSESAIDFYYSKAVSDFDNHSIIDVFPYWKPNCKKVINVGILGFFDDTLQKEYLDFYYKIKDWYFTKYPNKLHKRLDTMIIEQYCLGCLLESKDIKEQPLALTNDYSHFYGGIKYENFFVKMIDSYIKNEL